MAHPIAAELDWRQLWMNVERSLRTRGFADSTLRLYRRILRKLYTFATTHPDRRLRAWKPGAVTGRLVDDFLHKVNGRQVSWSWLASHISVIRTTFDKLTGLDITNDIRTPKRPFRLPDVLSGDEITRLIESAPTLRDRLLIGLMYGCGLRVGETCALRWVDVNVGQRVLKIVNARTTRTRELPIPVPLLDILTQGVSRCPGNEFIFPGAKPGKALSARIIERHITEIANTTGIHRIVTCMVLRHSYAVECLRAGMSVEQLRQNLGHVFVRSTLIYQHCLLPANIVSPADKLHPSEPVLTDAQDSVPDTDLASRISHPVSDSNTTQEAPTTPHRSLFSTSPPCSPFTTPTVHFAPPPFPFPTIPAGHQGFCAMLKTRLRNRFLAMKDYINTA